MKSWSIHIATIAGTQVRIHATFFLLLLLLAWQASSLGGLAVAVNVIAFVLMMFGCVLLHEFGHVFAARRYGIRTPDIILLPIGGMARLERMPREPVRELIVALAGPAVNIVIAGVIFLFLREVPLQIEFNFERDNLLKMLAQWNLFMVVFNMIPAFPMDGGRVLRALLAMVLDYRRATLWASGIGRFVAVTAAIAALLYVRHPTMIVIIAIFIYISAGQEAAYVEDQEATRGLRVKDAMMTQFQTLGSEARVDDAVKMLLAGSQHDFPVLNEHQELVGILTRRRLIEVLAASGTTPLVSSVMEECGKALSPTDDLSEAMDQLRISNCPALPVLEKEGGSLMGLLTAENVGEMLMVRQALQRRVS